MADIKFDHQVFSAPAERVLRFANTAEQCAGGREIRQVLDIGCGTGRQLYELAQRFPAASLTGVDISQPNIEVASAAFAEPRLRFLAADYLQLPATQYDLIVSYSTLHLISGTTSERLFQRIAEDLRPGGLLVAALPYACAYNHALISVRKLMRLIRCPAVDRLVLWFGKLLTGPGMTDAQLRERLIYMYLVPERLVGTALRQAASRAGLQLVQTLPEHHASIAQPKHRVVVFQRESTA